MNSAKTLFKNIKSRLNLDIPEQESHALIYLLMDVKFSLDRKDIITDRPIPLKNAELKELEAIITRLNKQEPLQYVLGITEFYGLPFNITTDVLIPRPETEELVDLIIKENPYEGLKILDIGTGSGCIAISLGKNMNPSKVDAIDVSAKALDIARENSHLNKVEINFIHADVLGLLAFSNEYEIIVSNPPYVTEEEKLMMSANVLEYEPHSALFVPDDSPLLFYNLIVKLTKQNLVQGGRLYFEINEKFGHEVKEMMEGHYFTGVEIIKDMQGKDRIVKGTKMGGL